MHTSKALKYIALGLYPLQNFALHHLVTVITDCIKTKVFRITAPFSWQIFHEKIRGNLSTGSEAENVDTKTQNDDLRSSHSGCGLTEESRLKTLENSSL